MPELVAIDTNIAIAALNHEQGVLRRLQGIPRPLLPFVVLSELLFGARNSSHVAANERNVRALAATMLFVPGSDAVCDVHANLALQLKRAGRPIPENDVWIAAVCLASDAILASRDAHFDAVEGLMRDEWR